MCDRCPIRSISLSRNVFGEVSASADPQASMAAFIAKRLDLAVDRQQYRRAAELAEIGFKITHDRKWLGIANALHTQD